MNPFPSGFKLRTVIDRFAWDLLLILRDTFNVDTFDPDHVKLRILMTLSDVRGSNPKQDAVLNSHYYQKSYRSSYVKDLLYRDYNASRGSIWHTFYLPSTKSAPAQTIRIHDEAITYLSSVLERRLTLAQNLKEKPTNLHQLFICFCKHSTLHPDWNTAHAVRHLDYLPAETEKIYFRTCARKLTEQRSYLGTSFSKISHRRREQYGALWLVVGDCKAELPEEFSLFDVFDAIPLALHTDFYSNSLLQKTLIRVLDALNERYKLLRSAGLSPQTWLERTVPSIAILRDLRQLRTEADTYLKTGKSGTVITAFRIAFDAKQTVEQRKKVAGCLNFDEFAQTEYGQAMIKYSALSLDQSTPNCSDDALSLYDALPGSDFEEEMVQAIFSKFGDDFDWVQSLIDCRPELFDEVSIMFFQQAIGMDCPLDDASSDQPLLKNKQFIKLINKDPRYKHLTTEELTEQLIEQANIIIDQGICLSERYAKEE